MATASSANDNKVVTVKTESMADSKMVDNESKEKSSSEGAKKNDATPNLGGMEEKFNQYLVSPMLAEMEKNVQKSTEILDRINAQMEEERKTRIRQSLTSHIPEALKGSGQKIENIMQTIEELIVYDDIGDDSEDKQHERQHARILKLSNHGQASVLAHSIVAYVSTLDEEHLKKFTAKITSDCELWLSRLFRFPDSSAVYHEDDREGLVKVCRLALYQKFPKYATEGYDALYSRPPVIYLSSAAKPGLGHYLCLQLGLPLSCVCTVSCNTMFGGTSKIDVSMLEKLIQDDISAAKKPTLLIGYAGTPQVGHVDNLQRLQDICKKNSIWLHVEGNNLATLMMFSVPSSIKSAKSGDSMTIDLGKWLGIPALPYTTLFKTPDPTLAHCAGLNHFNPRLKLSCLSIWICLQSLGHDGIVSRIKTSTHLAKKLFEHLDKIPTIRQISREKKETQRDITSLGDLISRAINALLVFEIVTPTVVFRYGEDTTAPGAVIAPYASNDTDDTESITDDNVQYYNALNNWLVDTLQCTVPKLPVTSVDVIREGVCIRYSPLETAQFSETTEDDVEAFVNCLTENLEVLDATVAQRSRFRSVVESNPNLILVQLDSWAGLGAVRYIPDHWLNKEETDRAKIDISNINSELVHKLKSMDTAFSTGHCDDNRVCVRFGLITSNTDVEELIALVQSTGKEIEESSKYLESLSEIIKKNIETANHELQKENESKLLHEGVMRQVPLVGSLINWWSPTKETTKGRTFNLTSGTIESTEPIYKCHMQIQPNTSKPSSPKPQSSPKPSTSPSSLATPLPSSPSPATSPVEKTAGDIKAGIINQTADTSKSHIVKPSEKPTDPTGPATSSVEALKASEAGNSEAGNKEKVVKAEQ